MRFVDASLFRSLRLPLPHRRSGPVRGACLAVGLGLLVSTLAAPAPATAQSISELQPSAIAQIEGLMAEKASRTPAQLKISSDLVIEIRHRKGELDHLVLPERRTPSAIDASGAVTVDIRATVSERLLRSIETSNGRIISAVPRFDAVRAHLPLAHLETLASRSDVRWIRTALPMITQMINTTEGDVAHGTDSARATFGIDGTGVLACAMSDSVESLASLQGSGDLPAGVTVLSGQAGTGTSEGTALLEIIFDMAPGASLAFATGQGGEAQMAQNILDLATLGCNVIVDDVLYLGESVFQDGVISQAVNTVAGNGVLYFTSAGNSGNLNSGNSGVWEGDYAATTLPTPLAAAGESALDFDAGDNANEITEDPPFFFTLQWADPFGGSSNDYDLFIIDGGLTTVISSSTNPQNGSEDPLEFIDSLATDHSGQSVVVVKVSGNDRFLHLNTHRGRLESGTDGQIFGHPAAEGALTVAAVDVFTAGGDDFTGGKDNPVEDFSSDGPRRIFFDGNGDPIPRLPGDTASKTPEGVPSSIVRQKPDIAAADGVSTATPGFNPFFGTSASAPHAAGISALFLELFPSISVDSAYDIFRSTALDIEDPGFDRDSGAGIIMAEPSLSAPIFTDGFESGNTSAWTK